MSSRFTPKLIISDWDETITTKDTIKLVSETAYLSKPNYKPNFDHFTSVYLNAYDQYSKRFKEKNGARDSLEKEVLFQKQLKEVEMTSINEITRLELFKGISPEHFKAQSSKVTIRPHFVEFLNLALKNNIPVIILSVNWSKIMIEATLAYHKIDVSKLQIIVNDLEIDEATQLTTGKFSSLISVRTGIDKWDIVKRLIKDDKKDVVYIGDSSTDLLSILEVQVGIIMQGGSVLKSLKDLNIPLKNLSKSNDLQKNTKYVANWQDLINKFYYEAN